MYITEKKKVPWPITPLSCRKNLKSQPSLFTFSRPITFLIWYVYQTELDSKDPINAAMQLVGFQKPVLAVKQAVCYECFERFQKLDRCGGCRRVAWVWLLLYILVYPALCLLARKSVILSYVFVRCVIIVLILSSPYSLVQVFCRGCISWFSPEESRRNWNRSYSS